MYYCYHSWAGPQYLLRYACSMTPSDIIQSFIYKGIHTHPFFSNPQSFALKNHELLCGRPSFVISFLPLQTEFREIYL